MRIRVAGLVELNNGYALMHRKNVKKGENPNQPYGEYYVFPGGGLEEDDGSLAEGAKREILEEFGIIVKVNEELCSRRIENEFEEHLFLCEYISGEFGSGTGPEFSGDPKYKERGEYLPEIISKENFKNLRVLPIEFKEKIIEKFHL